MSRAPVLFGRLCHILIGYLFAVGVAVIVTVAAYLAPSALPDAGAWGSIHANLRELPSMFAAGFMITFPVALPGFLIAVFFSILLRWRSQLPFTLAGGANGLFSWLILGTYLWMSFASFQPLFVAASMIGGLAGGFAYWAVTGWVTAGWRKARA